MHPQSQAKLLRAIEAKSFRRLGGREEVNVDVRIVAATNRDVPKAIHAGELREDLYYRLNVIELHLPPLRERREDLPLLAGHFLSLFSEKYGTPVKRFTPRAMEKLASYDWPGNIREFRNLMERTVLVCPEEEVDVPHLPDRMAGRGEGTNGLSIPDGTSLAEGTRLMILRTLSQCSGNKTKAARVLGMSRKALYDRLRLYGKEP